MECTDNPITVDEAAEAVARLPEASTDELKALWNQIQAHKWHGGEIPTEILFERLELPIIMRLHPPSEVNPKVKKLISTLNKRAQTYSKNKLQKYHELRRYGISIEKARDSIKPTFNKEFLEAHATLYARPFTYKYDISIHDADLIYAMGMDRFIKTFFDRFYQPIDEKK